MYRALPPQRQRLRQQILRQQQQKSAIQQEKGLLQETVAAPSPGTPRHWSHEDSAPQNDMFGRPPPPYPGPMRGGQRFPGTFLGDQRGHFPNEGQFARPHFPRDMGNMGLRPQGMRLVKIDSIAIHKLWPFDSLFFYGQGLYHI